MDHCGQKHQINVQIVAECDDADVDICGLENLTKAVCDRFNLCKTNVSIAIVDDQEFCRLNRQFRKSDSISDCLSFDLSDEAENNATRQFEIILNIDQAAREAGIRGHSIRAELALYLTHGLLHNLGFDDANDTQAELMHATEDKILEASGYGKVYNNNTKEQGCLGGDA